VGVVRALLAELRAVGAWGWGRAGSRAGSRAGGKAGGKAGGRVYVSEPNSTLVFRAMSSQSSNDSLLCSFFGGIFGRGATAGRGARGRAAPSPAHGRGRAGPGIFMSPFGPLHFGVLP
jgi:hypothetical protein